MASKDNRSNRKIGEFFSPTAPGASHVGNNSNAESTAVSNEVEMRGVAEVTERTNVPLDSTQSQSLLELDLPSYPDIENLTDDDLKKDEVRTRRLAACTQAVVILRSTSYIAVELNVLHFNTPVI